jgi:hypothetical protein
MNLSSANENDMCSTHLSTYTSWCDSYEKKGTPTNNKIVFLRLTTLWQLEHILEKFM